MPFGDIARLMLDSSDPREIALFTQLKFERVPEYPAVCAPGPPGAGHAGLLRPRPGCGVQQRGGSYLYPMLEAWRLRLLDAVWPFRQGYPGAAIPELMGQLGVERALFVGDRLEDGFPPGRRGACGGIRNGLPRGGSPTPWWNPQPRCTGLTRGFWAAREPPLLPYYPPGTSFSRPDRRNLPWSS